MDTDDSTAPYQELEAFDSIWQALRWQQVRKRVPVCFKKTLRNRYMLANLIYVGYAIGLLVIDFNADLNPSTQSSSTETTEETGSPLDQPVSMSELANRIYIGNVSSSRIAYSRLVRSRFGSGEYRCRVPLLVGLV